MQCTCDHRLSFSQFTISTLPRRILGSMVVLGLLANLAGCGESSGPRSVATLVPATVPPTGSALPSATNAASAAQGRPTIAAAPMVSPPETPAPPSALAASDATTTPGANTPGSTESPVNPVSPGQAIAPATPTIPEGVGQQARPVADQAPAAADPMMQQFGQALVTALAKLEKIPGYTYTLRKQELVGDELLDPQTLDCKLRHDPFSVYLCFTAPDNIKGKEAIYVEGQNDGKLVGHGVGLQALLGTQKLDPQGTFAMMGNRHPITNSGMRNLMNRLKKAYDGDQFRQQCRVQISEGEKIDDRPTRLFEAHNPQSNGSYRLARARVWFDQEWQLPVRYQSHYWNDEGKEQLTEDYTYLKVKFDAQLTDDDFDPANPDYQF